MIKLYIPIGIKPLSFHERALIQFLNPRGTIGPLAALRPKKDGFPIVHLLWRHSLEITFGFKECDHN